MEVDVDRILPQLGELPVLMTKKRAAELLSISLRTITTLVSTKQLACRRIGRRTLIPSAALLAFAKRGCGSPRGMAR